MMHKQAFKIGQEIRSTSSGITDYGFVIGYAKQYPDVIVMATQQHVGCPIHISNCEERDNFDLDLAMWCRKRYENIAPDYLMEITL